MARRGPAAALRQVPSWAEVTSEDIYSLGGRRVRCVQPENGSMSWPA